MSVPPTKRRRQRIVGVAAAALATAMIFSGCATGGDSSDEPVTLEFWTWTLKGGDERVEAILDQYHQEHPNVTVKVSEVGGTADSSSKLLAADKANDTPDLVQVEYRGLPSLVTAGVVRDITEDVKPFEDGIAPNIWSLTTLDGAIYGVPQDIGPMMITYRKDLFEQFGVKVPTTWAEYAEAAEQIHTQDPSVYIAAFSASEFEFFASQSAQAGAKWWSNEGSTWSVGIDDEPSLKVAAFWQDLVDRDLVKVEHLVTPEWNSEVNSGKILSWAAAAWVPSVIYSVAPDTAGKWESAPMPQWTPGDASVPFLGGSTYIVPTKSEHAKEAAEFAAWLGASDEGSKLLLGLDIYPAGNGGREATLSADPPKLMPDQTDFYEIADGVIKNTTIKVTWGPNVDVAQTTFGDALDSAALNKSSFADAFSKTQKAVTDDLEKSGYQVSK